MMPKPMLCALKQLLEKTDEWGAEDFKKRYKPSDMPQGEMEITIVADGEEMKPSVEDVEMMKEKDTKERESLESSDAYGMDGMESREDLVKKIRALEAKLEMYEDDNN